MRDKIFSYDNYKIIITIGVLITIIAVMGWIILYQIDNSKIEVRYIDRVITNERVVTEYVEVENDVYWYHFHATGYSPDDPSQGTNRTMASGKEVYIGAVAVDPDIVPLGTKLEIRGLPNGWDGIYVAEDTGGAIKNNRIDVFRELKSRALQINCDVWVRIIE